VVGPKVGEDVIRRRLATVLGAASHRAYVWFRFEWQFASADDLDAARRVTRSASSPCCTSS